MKSVLCALLLCIPRLAAAHHVISDYGIAPVEPRSFAEISVETARFDRAGRAGTFQLLTPSLEYALERRVSLSAQWPLVRVAFEEGATHRGVGDLELGAKVSLYATPHGGLVMAAGMGVELPTGDQDTGLGGGHVEAAPFVALSSAVTLPRGHELVFVGLLSDRAALHRHEHADAVGSVVAPHANNELSWRVTVAFTASWFYLSAGMDGVQVLDGDEEGPWVVRGELGALWNHRVRLAVGLDHTVAGDARFEYRVRVGLGASL
jgi:hypothetical protein